MSPPYCLQALSVAADRATVAPCQVMSRKARPPRRPGRDCAVLPDLAARWRQGCYQR